MQHSPRRDDLDFGAFRLGPFLGLPQPLKEAFEQDTRAERIRQIRATVLVGLVFYNAYNLSNAILMPDLGWLPSLLRAGVTLIAVVLMWALPRLESRLRETLVAVAMTGASAVPVSTFWLSDAPLSPYSFSDVFQTCVFAYALLVLRFPAALAYTGACLAMTLAAIWTHPLVGSELQLALTLQILTCTAFLLFGNWLIQRTRRQSYIEVWLRTREARELDRARQAFAALSATDPLTGIANRRRFDEVIAEAHARARTGQASYAVLMIDVDHFKRFNDAYGHPKGDTCLRAVAGILTSAVESRGAMVARYGGEEFAVVLRGGESVDALELAQHLVRAVETHELPHAHRPDAARAITVSIGAAIFDRANSDLPTAVILAADQALYEAKRRGRNRAVLSGLMERVALSA